MNLLFYDTETNGMPLWDKPSDDPEQPHLVQIAAALVDSDTRRDLAALNFTITTNGWTIDPDTQAVHGISATRTEAVGMPERTALEAFMGLWERCDLRVGHVESFDARILRIAIKRYLTHLQADLWTHAPAHCTHHLAKAHVPELKPKGMGSLRQVHLHYTGQDFDDAHSAEADMRATQRVWFAMQDAGHV